MNTRQLSRQCSIGNVATLDNLFLAARKARRGKSRRPDVEAWWMRHEVELLALREELLSGSYTPGAYRFFTIYEPKQRLIAAAPFRDRVVHHALCNYMAPLLERRFIARSFSCQIGKGTTAARECCRTLTNSHRYVLKCDVRKFYDSIDHAILLGKLRELVRCPHVMNLILKILGGYGANTHAPFSLFPGDDLVEASQRARGLPIGNLTSQLWGNFYLDALDHCITEKERHGAYLRYTDDFLLFGDDPGRLWKLRGIACGELAVLRLRFAEPKSRLLATREGVPFCGFRFLPELRPRVLGVTKRRFETRRYRLARTGNVRRLSMAIFNWYQFSREGNSEGLRKAYVCWPLDARLKRRRGKTARVVRGASWNNNNPENLLSSNRNNDTPDNRNDNNGFRCVLVAGSSRKAATCENRRDARWEDLPRRSQ
jgi:RNA-directed DNA polymerase